MTTPRRGCTSRRSRAWVAPGSVRVTAYARRLTWALNGRIGADGDGIRLPSAREDAMETSGKPPGRPAPHSPGRRATSLSEARRPALDEPDRIAELPVPGIGHRLRLRIPCSEVSGRRWPSTTGCRPAIPRGGRPRRPRSWKCSCLLPVHTVFGCRWPVGRPVASQTLVRGPHRPHRSGDYGRAGRTPGGGGVEPRCRSTRDLPGESGPVMHSHLADARDRRSREVGQAARDHRAPPTRENP